MTAMVSLGKWDHALGYIPIMDVNKSLDEVKFIAHFLSDVQLLHNEVYSLRDAKLDARKVSSRTTQEGLGFITKTLPRLGKAFDRALSGEVSLDSTGFRKIPGSQIPRFLGSLFQRVFTLDGWVLPTPCVACIATIRQALYWFYKYELPYERDQEQEVIDSFKKAEDEILDLSLRFSQYAKSAGDPPCSTAFMGVSAERVITRARTLLARLFSSSKSAPAFDHRDIVPSHGPGAVSTKEQLDGKWTFRTVSPRITETYPLDEYFFSSLGHVSDRYDELQAIKISESSARVCLVPKDSRGPRLISCESLDFQWIQQGLSRAIVKRVESHPLTRWNVNFTNQQPNQFGALLGSKTGRYATLDLKEASDRVSVGLVQMLFPEPVLTALMNCRSLSTELPGGEIITLNKYAPMGSALCFPVLALTVWAILSAGARDANTRESILVYGDDVIVPTAYAANAIELLEAFGLKVNRAKSCTSGFFRESCGTDAYKGVNVTPVRIRTVWSSHRCPHVYTSWIAYANSLYNKRYFNLYKYVTDALFSVYGEIPATDSSRGVPALIEVPDDKLPKYRRVNHALQRLEYKVWDVRSLTVSREIDGWKMLLRFFTEGQRPLSLDRKSNCELSRSRANNALTESAASTAAFSVRQYTKRKTLKLVKRWR